MKTARDPGRVGFGPAHSGIITRTMGNKFTGTGPAGRTANSPGEEPRCAMPATALDVQIVQRGRRWKWQVRNQIGVMLMQGWERSRPLARYQGYSALLLLLRVYCLHPPQLR